MYCIYIVGARDTRVKWGMIEWCGGGRWMGNKKKWSIELIEMKSLYGKI